MAGAVKIYRLHAAMEHIEPAVWREVEVPSNMTLTGLHGVMQALMGWHDAHLWVFEHHEQRFEPADPEASAPLQPAIDPDRVTLGTLLASRGDGLRYNYDFGDDWWLGIKVVSVGNPQPNVRYPRCIAGERAGPPEDCGGLPGFEELLAAHKNPRSRQAKELLAWAGPGWDPEKFDLALINKTLAALLAPRRLH